MKLQAFIFRIVGMRILGCAAILLGILQIVDLLDVTTDILDRGLGGAGVHTECISWGKEAAEGRNVMVFTDLTIALPLLCQGLAEAYGPSHVRPSRAAIAAGVPLIAAITATCRRTRSAASAGNRS